MRGFTVYVRLSPASFRCTVSANRGLGWSRKAETKRLLVGAAVVGAGVCAGRCGRGRRGLDFGKIVERMPDNAPPKWMFRNISAIRANTDRILELLDRDRSGAADERLHASA